MYDILNISSFFLSSRLKTSTSNIWYSSLLVFKLMVEWLIKGFLNNVKRSFTVTCIK